VAAAMLINQRGEKREKENDDIEKLGLSFTIGRMITKDWVHN